MFRKLGDMFRNFMMGRYGSDTLNKWLLICGVVLILLGSLFGNLVPWMTHLGLVAYVPLIWCIFRMYSRNIQARRKENAAFVNFCPARSPLVRKNVKILPMYFLSEPQTRTFRAKK